VQGDDALVIGRQTLGVAVCHAEEDESVHGID
jgi:hypothetical protein